MLKQPATLTTPAWNDCYQTTKQLADATILIVEDNADNLMIYKRLIGRLCKFCDSRHSGAHMFGFLAAHPKLVPDLILLDINIPDENGYIILGKIRERRILSSVRVIAVTADITQRNQEMALRAGFDGFIGKPFNL